jgi:hypothetical protein
MLTKQFGRIEMGRISQIFLLVFVFPMGLLLTSTGQEHTPLVWRAGAYKGLITGVSRMQDVVRKLGKPKLKTRAETNDPTEWEWHYEQHESNGSCCDLSFRKGILQGIALDLGELEQSKAAQMFGGRFIKVRFSTDDARGGGGSSPLCEDKNGDQFLLLDARRGLFLWVDADGKVSSATFSSTRPGIGKCRKK